MPRLPWTSILLFMTGMHLLIETESLQLFCPGWPQTSNLLIFPLQSRCKPPCQAYILIIQQVTDADIPDNLPRSRRWKATPKQSISTVIRAKITSAQHILLWDKAVSLQHISPKTEANVGYMYGGENHRDAKGASACTPLTMEGTLSTFLLHTSQVLILRAQHLSKELKELKLAPWHKSLLQWSTVTQLYSSFSQSESLR
jgi:hypothetical protein